MIKNIFIMSSSPGVGKSSISLGLTSVLNDYFPSLGYFKPIITTQEVNGVDLQVSLIRKNFDLPTSQIIQGLNINQINEAFLYLNSENNFNEIIHIYKTLEQHSDFVIIDGIDYTGTNQNSEFALNVAVAKGLGSSVILVEQGNHNRLEDIINFVIRSFTLLKEMHIKVFGLIINFVKPEFEVSLKNRLKEIFKLDCEWIAIITESNTLAKPCISDISHKLNAKIFCGEDQLTRQVNGYTIAAKTVNSFFDSEKQRDGLLIITPGDREDLILSCLLANQSKYYPKIAGLLLTTGIEPKGVIKDIIFGLKGSFPILTTEKDSFIAATELYNAKYHLYEASPDKIKLTVEQIRACLDEKFFMEQLTHTINKRLTPSMFTYSLLQQAKNNKQHIVLAEGMDIRILQAAAELLKIDAVNITLLGNFDQIQALIKQHSLDLTTVNIIEPGKSLNLYSYAEHYFNLRKHKGINMTIAIDKMHDVNYYGSMMVYMGDCDGMVSGAAHTTGETIRPALEFIKMKAGCNLVSSFFLMLLDERVLIYGDCAINPNPNAEALAEIGYFSAKSAEKFGIDAKIAMLSYSSGASGAGMSVDKVREATNLLKYNHPELLIEGPIQYDAAVDMEVALKKVPNSPVAGQATVLIFPDLNTGNNTYKAVQRETGATAIGPILQGLNKPVNDLSRGCTVKDIVNTVLITSIQAQGNE